jgi:hypothetical protein
VMQPFGVPSIGRVRDLVEFKGVIEIRSGETWNANLHMGRRHTQTSNTAFVPAGGWWKKWDEVCDQAFGANNEVSEKIGPTLFLKPLSTQEITGFSRILGKYLFTREIEDRAIHLLPPGHKVAVSAGGRQDRHST